MERPIGTLGRWLTHAEKLRLVVRTESRRGWIPLSPYKQEQARLNEDTEVYLELAEDEHAEAKAEDIARLLMEVCKVRSEKSDSQDWQTQDGDDPDSGISICSL